MFFKIFDKNMLSTISDTETLSYLRQIFCISLTVLILYKYYNSSLHINLLLVVYRFFINMWTKENDSTAMKPQTTTISTKEESLKEGLASGIYDWANIPYVFSASAHCTFVSKDGSIPDLDQSKIDSFLGQNIDMIKTNKLSFASCGDWDLSMRIVHSKYFNDRKTLDDAFVRKHNFARSDPDHDPLMESSVVDSISLKDAFRAIDVRVSVNLGHCLSEICEIMKINAKEGLSIDFEKMSQSERSKLEEEVLYELMCKWFGGKHEVDN